MSPRVAVIGILSLALVSSVLTSLAVPDRSFSHSSYNVDPFGTKLLYRLVEDSGRPVERWRAPLGELDEERGVLVLAAPFARHLSAHEAEAIEGWVARGNGLLLASTHAAPWSARGESATEWVLLDGLGFEEPPELQDWEQSLLLTAPQLEISKLLQPALRSPLVRDLGQLAGGSLVRTAAPVGAWAPLLARGGKPHSWMRDFGAGRVVVLLEPGPLENRLLGEGDNHRFVLRLLDALRIGDGTRDGGTIWFEETVHGHLLRPDVPWADTDLRWMLLIQVLLVALIYVLGRAPRLGPPAPHLARTSRSTVELADSMAALYGLARVRRDAVTALWQHAERECARHPEAAARLEAVEERARELAAAGRLKDRDLVELDETIVAAFATDERERT